MTIQITIIGLGQIGASLGLALGGSKEGTLRVGHDRSPEAAKKAEKIGAVDKVVFNLHQSVEKADYVILAIPVDQIQETLKHIAPDLKENTILLDTSYAMTAVSQWVKELFPVGCCFATLAPSLNPKYLEENKTGSAAAHADLFHKSVMVITSSTGMNPEGVRIAAELASIVGASPLFADPLEFDGLTSASHFLPQLAAAALAHAVMDQPGWREGRKLAGKAFTVATLPLAQAEDAKSLAENVLLNRAVILQVIDNYISELHALRFAIDEQDAAGLQQQLKSAVQARELWWQERGEAAWETNTHAPMPTTRDMLGSLIGVRPKKQTEKK
jgi:prephenate dehydrogenase